MFLSEQVNKPHAELAEDGYISCIIIITVITPMSAFSLLVHPEGQYTGTGRETLSELFRVHFPY
jgi:hypothetical protein